MNCYLIWCYCLNCFNCNSNDSRRNWLEIRSCKSMKPLDLDILSKWWIYSGIKQVIIDFERFFSRIISIRTQRKCFSFNCAVPEWQNEMNEFSQTLRHTSNCVQLGVVRGFVNSLIRSLSSHFYLPDKFLRVCKSFWFQIDLSRLFLLDFFFLNCAAK